MTPTAFRHSVRNNAYQKPTAGICPGFAQANLIVLPKKDAYDFLSLAQRNPKPIPILEVTEIGNRHLQRLGADIWTQQIELQQSRYFSVTKEAG